MELKYWPGTAMQPPEFAFRTHEPQSSNDANWEICSYPGGPRLVGRHDSEMTEDNGWIPLAIPLPPESKTIVVPSEPQTDVPQNYLQ